MEVRGSNGQQIWLVDRSSEIFDHFVVGTIQNYHFFFTPALSPEILSPTLDKLSQLTLNNIDGYLNIPWNLEKKNHKILRKKHNI